jgi:flagellar M-ring protein FliF
VDGRYAPPTGGGDPVYTPLSEEELNQIQRVVRTAIGIDTSRGDRIEVVNMQFREREAPAPEPGLLGQPWLESAPQLVGKVLLVVVAIILVLVVRRNLGRLVSDGVPVRRSAAAVGGGGGAAGGVDPLMPSIRDGSSPDNSARMITEVKDYAAENPDAMAELIHTWVTDNPE